MDILVKPDAGNAKAVFAALAQFGAPPPFAASGMPLQGMTPADFAESGSFFRMGREPVAVDILSEIPGVDFDAAWERRVEGVIDTKSGLKAFFISRDDLIATKLASGRTRDLADVEDIRAASQSVGPASPKKKPPEPTQSGTVGATGQSGG
jgi:hypothetical protein